jgi:hypothetical protein
VAFSGSILLTALAAVPGPLLAAAKGGADAGGDAMAALAGMMTTILVITALIAIPTIVGAWKAFTKAGQPGWAAIIPFYNVYVMNQIAKKEPLWFILYIVGAVICGPLSLVAIVVINLGVAEKFGKGAGYGIGLSFLPFIFWPMLGFGDARYRGGRRSRDYDDDYDDEDEEEEEERPRKKKARDYDEDDEDDRPRKRKSRDYDD